MDALQAILTRRSVRRFSPTPVAQETVTALLRAAMAAPSAGNEQPWEFVVIRDRGILDEIPKLHPYAAMAKEASVVVAVCGDTAREKYEGFWVQDCSAATENLLLAAHAQGLGAVWVGVHPRPERVEAFRKLLGLPKTIIPLCLVPIGYPAEPPAPADRFDPSRVHEDRFARR